MVLVLCEQRQALLRTGGNILVRGGAGSGKTTIALAKACADLQAQRLDPDGKALFLSFARATIARVAERATATIPRALMSRIEINTYHGFAWTVLRSHGYLLCAKPGVSLLLPAQARSRLAGTEGDARVALQRQLFEREGLIAFDLFPTLLTELFERAPSLAAAYGRAYPLIIVDEFQDTNADEWRMISRLGRQSRLIALGDPKQRIYDFKGADPRRFDEFIATFNPTPFDFRGENNRSAGTAIPNFADDIITGEFTAADYAGVTILRYRGRSLRRLKQHVLRMVARLRRNPEWSLAILVPTNALAVNVFDYMAATDHGLPSYPVDIVVAAEGPMLAANLIALLMEPEGNRDECAANILHGLAAFELGRIEEASDSSIRRAVRYRTLAAATRTRGLAALGTRGIGPGVQALVDGVSAVSLTGDPIADWRTLRALFSASDRAELVAIGREARHMRLLRRGAQIESRLADAWRTHGAYRDARVLLAAALTEDQFAATSRSHRGATVMTIHKAKGKEFDEVVVFEGTFQRYMPRRGGDAERSARFNLHVAVTRAREAVTVMTPLEDPCRLLPT
ncbi:UvrD-helicase domain-containing protein [Bradyrhizobium sp. ERR14]|uniref:UvrD-helicase domain-containing protein n=1 Tax=Bradyrhizobium sp. ERR14 TaxID=2663837 RepID=UPI0016090C3F|nr:UvrD-helicase domain-containing protein [Bradyrhizobium sp. ERR14]MBB4398826.1 DNA helicase-2/ATP-dependent DNA helicase PcrA [Bradyrhizobium sp. ERR14]